MSFLDWEDADIANHMHMGLAMIFDAHPAGGTPSLDTLEERARKRLHWLPRLGLRLSSPPIRGLFRPRWERAPSVDLKAHFRAAVLPAPGGEAELLGWLGDFYSRRLDRSRPLWEIVFLEGLSNGRWALVAKAHHCLFDGIGGAAAAIALMTDFTPLDTGDTPATISSDRSGESTSVQSPRLGTAFAGVRALARTSGNRQVPICPTSLNVPIGPERHLATIEAPLGRLHRVRNRLGGTVNDVVMVATVGGLRRLFEARGEVPLPDYIRAMVPVSTKSPREALTTGVQVSRLDVDLPLAAEGLLDRYHDSVVSSAEVKAGGEARRNETMLQLVSLVPPFFQRLIERVFSPVGLVNIPITNFPVADARLRVHGCEMRRILPIVPISSGIAAGVAAVSYADTITFAINADRAALPDLDVFKSGIEECLGELDRLAS